MLNKTDQSDRAPSPNEKPENCYCAALPMGPTCVYPAIRDGWRAGAWLSDRSVLRGQLRSSDMRGVLTLCCLRLPFSFAAACGGGFQYALT